jgi:hypothetical protein
MVNLQQNTCNLKVLQTKHLAVIHVNYLREVSSVLRICLSVVQRLKRVWTHRLPIPLESIQKLPLSQAILVKSVVNRKTALVSETEPENVGAPENNMIGPLKVTGRFWWIVTFTRTSKQSKWPSVYQDGPNLLSQGHQAD